MKYIWKIFGIICFAMMATLSFAQTDDGYESNKNRNDGYESSDDPFSDKWTDKLVYGGNIFPGYSNGWILDVSPWVGYKMSPTTVAGVGVNFSYRSYRNPYTYDRQMWRMYGGRVFVMQDLLMGVFAQAEYDYHHLTYRLKDRYDNLVGEFQGQSPGLLVGGGYAQRGQYMSYNLSVLYDLLYDSNSIGRPNSFGPLVIRGGVVFGL